MSVRVVFVSNQEVSSALRLRFGEDILSAAQAYDWWCEPPTAYEHPKHPGRLVGSMKLNVVAYSRSDGSLVNVAPNDDDFMASRDLRFLVQHLCTWSREQQLSWVLSVAGEDIGDIRSGMPSDSLLRYVSEMAPRIDPTNESQRAQELLSAYASRNEVVVQAPSVPAVQLPPPQRPTAKPFWRFW